jgi:tRNA dimethylallyltransferase
MGPTASGKTELAERYARLLGAQLINADAFQVYRGMDIGTAKPAAKELYRLLDLKDPHEPFGVGEWVRLAAAELACLWRECRPAVVVGGTGLYVRALFERYTGLEGPPDPALRAELMEREARDGLSALAEHLASLDPGAWARIDPRNPVRVRRALERALQPPEPVAFDLPPFARAKIGLEWDVDVLNERIGARTDALISAGWPGEVGTLIASGIGADAPGMRAIGYSALASWHRGEVCLTEATDQIKLATRQYARRQRTWMRSEPALFRLHRQPGDEFTDEELLALLAKARESRHGEDDQLAGHVS